MPKQQSQRRAQGGGRTANSEPKLQVFKDFSGVNFEQSMQIVDEFSHVDRPHDGPSDQTDLQMNYLFLQNNVATTGNKTLETRDDIVTLFSAAQGSSFTGPAKLIGSELYVAGKVNGTDAIMHKSLTSHGVMSETINVNDHTGSGYEWTSLDYYDDKLIALTEQNEMWTAPISRQTYRPTGSISNVTPIPNPTTDFTGHLTPQGDLQISTTMTQDCPYRIAIAHTWVNKYGPTAISPNTVFYANYPVSEWHVGRFLRIDYTLPNQEYGVIAVELYYTTDNAMSMIFFGRVDTRPDQRQWSYDWYGYVDATSMWPIANLIAPTENYTSGVPASRICNIDGRLYFWGDRENPQRLYIGGNPGNLLSVSPGTGGGFVDVEPGTNQAIRYVCKYKTQSGNSIVTMLCDSPNSYKEQRFNLVENTVSLSNEQNMKSWQAEQVAGAIGCKSYDGALVCEDGLYSVSRYGLALTTMTMEYNSQIRTNYVSDAIKPIFVDATSINERLSSSILLERDGVIYMALGKLTTVIDLETGEKGGFDNVLFCYDIDNKAWWTYTLDVDSTILNLFHVDWDGDREGIGIVTSNRIYMLPLTVRDDVDTMTNHSFLIETAQLSTQMPKQGWQYLSQLEFHFDYFVGEATIEVRMIDMFGRDIKVRKTISESEAQYDLMVHMRIDQRVMSYVITMTGEARFRMTHFIARVYTMSNKVSQVWGFDDSISHRSAGSIHPTFKCYNDVRRAIFT